MWIESSVGWQSGRWRVRFAAVCWLVAAGAPAPIVERGGAGAGVPSTVTVSRLRRHACVVVSDGPAQAAGCWRLAGLGRWCNTS